MNTLLMRHHSDYLIIFLMLIALLLGVGIWLKLWLENYYMKRDIEERERMIQEGQAVHCPDKLEARD